MVNSESLEEMWKRTNCLNSMFSTLIIVSVKHGAYHTIVLELNKQFTLTKQYWDSIALERVEEACDVHQRAEVAALLIEEGLANLCVMTESMTTTVAHFDVSIPRKRIQSQKHHDTAVERFFETVHEAVQRCINFDVVKCFIIAGPGFVKDQFYQYLIKIAVQKEAGEGRKILENRSKILVCSASSAHKNALKEILSDRVILEKMSDTKASREVTTLDEFYHVLQHNPDKATYGFKQSVPLLSFHSLPKPHLPNTVLQGVTINWPSKSY
eukprot:TRINITY_DN4452_c0_g1_i3.p1 TRINITY_DN4452_c0_g1~~TRINITY_DN4452_c0_g1_i3.p1  ORF type:complete len:269 (-),score=43.81 TRINITY_DN4452_c0_g1_i3:382-1188(-)